MLPLHTPPTCLRMNTAQAGAGNRRHTFSASLNSRPLKAALVIVQAADTSLSKALCTASQSHASALSKLLWALLALMLQHAGEHPVQNGGVDQLQGRRLKATLRLEAMVKA